METKRMIHRCPRLAESSAEGDVRKLIIETRGAMKELHVRKSLVREQQIKIGHSLIDIKLILKLTLTKHGAWQEFYEKTFVDSGVSLRSAQKYIKLARKEEKRTSSFLIGNDDEIHKVAERHKRAIEVACRTTPPPVFSLCLHFSNQAEKSQMQQFWKSNKQLLEDQTVTLWRRLLRESRRAA